MHRRHRLPWQRRSSSGTADHGLLVKSTDSASTGGPANVPRLPGLRQETVDRSDRARESAASRGTEANTAAGTSPPIPSANAKPEVDEGHGRPAVMNARIAAMAVEARSKPDHDQLVGVRAAMHQPARGDACAAIPSAVATATIRPTVARLAERADVRRDTPAATSEREEHQRKAEEGEGGKRHRTAHGRNPLGRLRQVELRSPRLEIRAWRRRGREQGGGK